MNESKSAISEMINHESGWNWEDKHVSQSYLGPYNEEEHKGIAINDIVESGTVLICAGPADLDMAVAAQGTAEDVGFRIVPIGQF